MARKNSPPPRVAALELLLFLGGAPLLALTGPGYAVRHGLLLAGCVYAVRRLAGRADWRRLGGMPPAGWWRGPVRRCVLAAVCILACVLVMEPDRLFILPRERPFLWILIVIAYPLLSVLPQEIIYRVYLFEAHAGLWTRRWLPVAVSAVSFGWVHIVFAGWFAVAATTLGGLLLAASYARARRQPGALWLVVLEHALYGLAVFTAGLGSHFFTPR